MRKLIYLFAVIVLCSCGGPKDSNIETTAKIYVERIAVEEKYSSKPDTLKVLYDQLYIKYKFPEAEYKKVFSSFSTDKKKWEMFFSLSEKYLDTLKNKKMLN